MGQKLFADLRKVASVLDAERGNTYQALCDKLEPAFADPSLTLSARVLDDMLQQGMSGLGLGLASRYHRQLASEPTEMVSEAEFVQEREHSQRKQAEIEAADTLSFDAYLQQQHF